MNTPKPKAPVKQEKAKDDRKSNKRDKPKKEHVLQPHLTHKPFASALSDLKKV